jgi:hypothetical protein
MSTWFSFVIACLALLVSGVTAWLTFLHKGRLVMTQPTQVFFGPDGKGFERNKNKVYLRTLLYCTAKRGYVLESLYLSLQRNETKQNFNIWVYGDKDDLKRGSGLFVPQEGVTFDHHFLLPEDGADFSFLTGAYTLKIIAKGVGQRSPSELMAIHLSINESQEKRLSEERTGIYFDWGPDLLAYHPHVQSRPEREPEIKKLLQFIEERRLS